MAPSESEKNVACLVGTGWEGKVFGRYNTGRILLGGQVKDAWVSDIKKTHISCLRSPFRWTSTLTQYSTSPENVGDKQAYEGGSGLAPPLTYDGNGMENGKDCSVGVCSPRAGQERTIGDVTILRLTTSEIIPLSEVIILTLPRSCKRKHIDQLCQASIEGKGNLNWDLHSYNMAALSTQLDGSLHKSVESINGKP
jgi:hypothetical protein